MQGTIASVSLSLFKILGIKQELLIPRSGAILSTYFAEPSISGFRCGFDYVLELLVEVVHRRKPLYLGLQAATKKEPLTYYDMNLSAQVIILREEVI